MPDNRVKPSLRILPTIVIAAIAGVMAGCSDGSDRPRVKLPDNEFNAPPSDCLWVGPYVKENEGFNFAYPDSGAIYWSAAYRLPEEGAYITLEADFPYSRYISYNSYREDTSPAQSLTDRDIVPESGSINPFVEGESRNDPYRRYVVSVLPGDPLTEADPVDTNTLYDATSAAGEEAVLLYRNYVPDEGSDQTGDVGLPRVTLHLADGSIVQGEEACEALSVGTEPLSIPLVPADIYQVHRDNFEPAANPPAFRATYGIPFLLQCDFRGDCTNSPERNTRFYANADNQYLYSFLNREIAEVTVIRARLPRVPETLEGQDFFGSGDLRYWSLCQNEFYSQEVKDCLFDEQVTVNPDGFFTIVTSRPDDRPDNASDECGVGYLPWPDNGDGFSFIEGRTDDRNSAMLILRNMLPEDHFDEAVQNTSVAGDEAQVMGEYLPRATYMSRAEFEGLGCDSYLALPYQDM
jgi:hypothetical protein